MAVDLTGGDRDDTTTGPLDVAKAAGADADDGGPPRIGSHGHHSGTEPLDGRGAAVNQGMDEQERLRGKNPLGYSITEPTEDEIEEGQPAGAGRAA